MDKAKLNTLLADIIAVVTVQKQDIAMLLESNRLTAERLAVMEKNLDRKSVV